MPSSQIPRFQCEVERQRFLEAAYTSNGGTSSSQTYPAQHNNDVNRMRQGGAGYLPPQVQNYQGGVERQRLGQAGGNSFGGIVGSSSNAASSTHQLCRNINNDNNGEEDNNSNNNGSSTIISSNNGSNNNIDNKNTNNNTSSNNNGSNNNIDNNNNTGSNNNGSNNNTKFNRPLPQIAIDAMTSWSNAHSSHVFPTRQQKEELAILGGITYKQVDKWFANLRVRQRKTKSPREIVAGRKRPASPVLRLQSSTTPVLPEQRDQEQPVLQLPRQSVLQSGQDGQQVSAAQPTVPQPDQGQPQSTQQTDLPNQQTPGNDILKDALDVCGIDLHSQSPLSDPQFAWLSDQWC